MLEAAFALGVAQSLYGIDFLVIELTCRRKLEENLSGLGLRKTVGKYENGRLWM